MDTSNNIPSPSIGAITLSDNDNTQGANRTENKLDDNPTILGDRMRPVEFNRIKIQKLPSQFETHVLDVAKSPIASGILNDRDMCIESDSGDPPENTDFTSIMFLSTGGATIAAQPSTVRNNPARFGSRASAGTYTWHNYNSFATRLFWCLIFPITTMIYLTIAAVIYTAAVREWKSRNTVTITCTTVGGSLTLLVTLWTGSIAFRLRKHPAVITKGLFYVAQIHLGVLLGIPVSIEFILRHAHIYIPSAAGVFVLDTYYSLCSFILFSAVIARQRQIVLLFCHSMYSDSPKNTYRNTVIYIGIMYIVANIVRVILIFAFDIRKFSYMPILVGDGLSMLLWIVFAYQSRHASARYSDFDQLRRLFAMVGIGRLSTQIWGYVQPEAFSVQNVVILELMVVFLLDSYFSLFYFIRYKLDPKCVRDVQSTPRRRSALSQRAFSSTTVASVLPKPWTAAPTNESDSKSNLSDPKSSLPAPL